MICSIIDQNKVKGDTGVRVKAFLSMNIKTKIFGVNLTLSEKGNFDANQLNLLSELGYAP